MQKNLDIHFFKFYYSCIVVLFHLTSSTQIHCVGGFIAVEFFLLTAGLFLFQSFERQSDAGKLTTPGQYLKKRFWRMFPWGATAFAVAVIIQRFVINQVTSMAQLMDYLSDDIWEILLVKWNGMNDDSLLLNGPAWTLSSMCIVGLLLWGLLTHCKKPFLQLIMPVTLLIGYGFWRHIPAANTELWIGFTTFGTFRTYLVMCLGYYCMLLSKTLHKVSFNRYGEVLLGICELLIHIFATWVMFHRETRNYQWLVTLLFLVAVAIAVSGKSYLCKLMNKVKAFSFLGEISMSIYLIHVPIIWLFKWKNDMSAWSYRELIPVFAAVLAAAVLHYYLTKWLIKAVPKAGRWIVGHFVSQENG